MTPGGAPKKTAHIEVSTPQREERSRKISLVPK
jgi:hypothetical protein